MSNESKHTPGPWTLLSPNKKGYRYLRTDRWSKFARVVTILEGSESEDPEGLANALLITAAPDMLKALELAYDHLIVEDMLPSEVGSKILSVIKKAKGEK